MSYTSIRVIFNVVGYRYFRLGRRAFVVLVAPYIIVNNSTMMPMKCLSAFSA